MVKTWFGSASGKAQDSGLRVEALQFMRGIMDECTYLGNFSVPVDPELVIVVAAKCDGYVPRGDGLPELNELWPSAEIRSVDMGHVAAFIFNQGVFRKAIKDSFERLTAKYYS
ncbi:unnamed protein product [Notodromas monacha]|uniref:Uncharacterized protein n=1 Tax=Notodromas monacha TaxID=399045 RepID=A0A7R9GDM4_9CRUS|nr:unnamed protein product [Notodromas monacha]CAG0917373.1 unnamed protein product [Notodromas monacha]